MYKDLGVGVGLRHPHHEYFIKNRPKSVSWFEVISENFMRWMLNEKNGFGLQKTYNILLPLRTDYEIALHGVSMSIGSTDPLNWDYLLRLKELVELVEPKIISDHLCWTGVEGQNTHDLLPLPYNEESMQVVVGNVLRVQDYLGRRIFLENPSSYFSFQSSDRTEWEFLSELATKADCGLLLDINNVYVSSINHQFDAKEYLKNIPHHRVGQIHLAGHSVKQGYCIDTHDEPVCKEVWELFAWYCQQYGNKSTMIERDDNIPDWQEIEDELQLIQKNRKVESHGPDLFT